MIENFCRFILFVLTLFCCFSALATEQNTCNHGDDYFQCIVLDKVTDGDTIHVELPGVHPLLGKKIAIRLRGIDTPESRPRLCPKGVAEKECNRLRTCEQDKALIAKKRVEHLISKAKRLDVQHCSREKYFRLLCDFIADGQSIAPILVGEGLAVAYDGGTKQKTDWCSRPTAAIKLESPLPKAGSIDPKQTSTQTR